MAHMMRQRVAALAVLAGLALSTAAAKDFRLPTPATVNSYPARDEHPQEHVTIALDPYDTHEKASLFPTDWQQHGYLPMLLIVANTGSQPIALNQMRIELVTANRSHLLPASDEDLYRRLSRTKRRGDEASPIPHPFPRRKADVGVSKQAQQEVDAAQFRAVVVEPGTTRSGFIFFDIEGVREPLAGAHLYLFGVRDSQGQELMFFDLPLDKYLQAPGK
jgi:hypothetical protein